MRRSIITLMFTAATLTVSAVAAHKATDMGPTCNEVRREPFPEVNGKD